MFTLQPSNHTANKILNAEFGGQSYTPPANLYIRAFSTVLTAAGVGSEISVDGYEALAIPNNETNFPEPTARTVQNAVQFETSVFEEDCTILSFGIWSAATGGNLLYYANFAGTPIEVLAGQTRTFPIGSIVLNLP